MNTIDHWTRRRSEGRCAYCTQPAVTVVARSPPSRSQSRSDAIIRAAIGTECCRLNVTVSSRTFRVEELA
jgi:hypothetical protein